MRRLGLEREPPSVDALRRIHRAFVERVPYETIWIHMDEPWGIDPADSLARIARRSRGGYCYMLNGALREILVSLGYRVTRHVGGVHGPDGPDVGALTNHLVLVVHDLPDEMAPEGDWYVDVGLGDGLYECLPLRAGSFGQAPMRFELTRTVDGVGDWHFGHDATGSFTGMSFVMADVGMDAFAARHVFLSTSPESSFARVATAQTRDACGWTILRGCVLERRQGNDVQRHVVDDRRDWFAVLADEFAIRPDGQAAAHEALWSRVHAAHEAWVSRDR